MKKFPLILLCALFANIARGDLKWEASKLEFSPAVSDEKVEAHFKFANVGKKPVRIESVNSQCGCTTAALQKHIYEPGEKGEITATFTIGQRMGLQSKDIHVNLKGAAAPTILTLVVKIPEVAKLSPQYLFWSKGEENTSKTIVLQALPEFPIRVLGVSAQNSKFHATFETVEENKQYKIIVAPEDTSTPVASALTINAELLPDHPRVFYAYAQVRAAKTP